MRIGLLVTVIVCVVMTCQGQPQNTNVEAVVATLNTRASQLIRIKPDSAFMLASEALELSQKGRLTIEQGKSQYILGTVLLHRGVYTQALTHLRVALNHFQDSPQFLSERAACFNQIGLLYASIQQTAFARLAHHDALSIYQQLTDVTGIAYTFGCIGQLFERAAKYDSALYYQQTALRYYKQVKNVQGEVIILTNLGTIYEHQQQYDTALLYYQWSLQKNSVIQDSLSIIRNLNNIGDVYRGMGLYQESLRFSIQALAIANRLSEHDEISRAYKDLSKTYREIGDYKRAFENADKSRLLYEKIYAQNNVEQAALFETLFEIDEKNDEINRLTSNRRQDAIIKIALIIGVILLILLAWTIINRQRFKLRKEREARLRNAEIHHAQQKIIRMELENTWLREKQLQEEVRIQARSLTSQALQMKSKSNVMEVVQEQLQGLMDEQPAGQRKKVKHLLKRIDHHTVSTENDWDNFRQTFENINDNFLEKLSRAFPDLTPAEIRLASLFRLNMTSKAMADTLGISADSLRIARYRLKKKLKLQEGQTLQAFILGF